MHPSSCKAKVLCRFQWIELRGHVGGGENEEIIRYVYYIEGAGFNTMQLERVLVP